MSKQKVIVVFDIGKTNKKVLLFDKCLKVVYQKEEKFETAFDEDGVECDDIDLIEKWIISSIHNLASNSEYDLVAVNFSTYGASLAFLDQDGNRLTPIYNYLKEIPESIQNTLFKNYGGEEEFCRKTASPALGSLLNSGIQILWLKQKQPELFNKAVAILHFPQYLSYTLTHKIVSESTSIGCHTFLWDFDNNQYHQWLKDENVLLPAPISNDHTFPIDIPNMETIVGIGIHDSSASLTPYIKGSKEKFLLISTGTWCINMNPFNHTALTSHQLESDCLSYLSIDKNPVKSSRLFMGHIHDVNTKRITEFFNIPNDSFKTLQTENELVKEYLGQTEQDSVFFKDGIPANYIDENVNLLNFANFSEVYHRLMFDLSLLNKKSIDLILSSGDGVENIYISGGFARNEIFVRLLANFYPDKRVFTSEVDNSSALGAALVVWDAASLNKTPEIDLGLIEWNPF